MKVLKLLRFTSRTLASSLASSTSDWAHQKRKNVYGRPVIKDADWRAFREFFGESAFLP